MTTPECLLQAIQETFSEITPHSCTLSFGGGSSLSAKLHPPYTPDTHLASFLSEWQPNRCLQPPSFQATKGNVWCRWLLHPILHPGAFFELLEIEPVRSMIQSIYTKKMARLKEIEEAIDNICKPLLPFPVFKEYVQKMGEAIDLSRSLKVAIIGIANPKSLERWLNWLAVIARNIKPPDANIFFQIDVIDRSPLPRRLCIGAIRADALKVDEDIYPWWRALVDNPSDCYASQTLSFWVFPVEPNSSELEKFRQARRQPAEWDLIVADIIHPYTPTSYSELVETLASLLNKNGVLIIRDLALQISRSLFEQWGLSLPSDIKEERWDAKTLLAGLQNCFTFYRFMASGYRSSSSQEGWERFIEFCNWPLPPRSSYYQQVKAIEISPLTTLKPRGNRGEYQTSYIVAFTLIIQNACF